MMKMWFKPEQTLAAESFHCAVSHWLMSQTSLSRLRSRFYPAAVSKVLTSWSKQDWQKSAERLIIQQKSWGWTSGMRIFKDNHLKDIILVTKWRDSFYIVFLCFIDFTIKPLIFVTASHFCFYGSFLVSFYIGVNNTFKNAFKEGV